MGVDLHAIGALIGTPYRKEEWNCMTCIAHVRQEFFGLQTPEWAQYYVKLNPRRPEEVAQAVAVELPRWQLLPEPRPGCVLLLKLWGARCHVGVYIGSDVFIHAMEGYDTVRDSLEDWTRKGRVAGAYEYV